MTGSSRREFYRFVAIGMLTFLILQMIFLSMGIFLGCALKNHMQAGPIAIWFLLGSYFLSVLVGLNKDLDFLKYLSPFKYFDPALLLRESRLLFEDAAFAHDEEALRRRVDAFCRRLRRRERLVDRLFASYWRYLKRFHIEASTLIFTPDDLTGKQNLGTLRERLLPVLAIRDRRRMRPLVTGWTRPLCIDVNYE